MNALLSKGRLYLKKNQIFNLSYFIFLSILILNDGIGNSVIPNYNESLIHDVLLIFDLLFAGICIVGLDLKCKTTYFKLFLIFIGSLCYVFSGKTGLLFTILACTLGEHIDFDKILKLLYYEKLLIFLCIVILSLFGCIGGREVLFNMFEQTEKGVTLGYAHANTFAAIASVLMLLHISVHRNKLIKLELGILFFLAVLVFIITKCKIAFFLMTLLLLLLSMRLNSLKSMIFKNSNKIFIFSIIVLFLLITFKILFNDEISLFIDSAVFHGRIGLAAEYFKTYPITMFGEVLDITLISSKLWYYALDCGFVIVLFYYGIIGALTYFMVFYNSINLISKNKDFVLTLIGLTFVVWTIYEGIMLSATSNFMLLAFNKALTFDNKCIKSKNI